MPCLEISMPRVDDATRERLASELTSAFTAACDMPADIFGIRFMEYDLGRSASGGRLWDGDAQQRPYLHFLLYCPRLGRSAKQELVKRLTQSFALCVGHDHWRPVIHICEHPYDNVGVDGNLLSDTFDDCARSPFYYELSDK